MSRLTPKPEVIRMLYALSGNQCAFTECQQVLITDKGSPIADICHIEAANIGGTRYNPAMNDEQRRSFENLILLCPNHHREIDNSEEYTVEKLRDIKRTHEEKFQNNSKEVSESAFLRLMNSIENQLSYLIDLSADTNNTTHTISSQLEELLQRIPGLPNDEFFTSQLEHAKSLKKQGKHSTAIDLLLELKEKKWDQLNAQSRFKLLANIGMTYLDLHQKGKAGEFLIAIKEIPYQSADSQAAICLGYAIAGRYTEFDEEFEQAKSIPGENINLWVGYIERHKREKRADEILLELPISIQNSQPILFTLGNVIIDEGRSREGIAILKKALALNTESIDRLSDVKGLIATRIIGLLVHPLKYAFRNYTSDELDELSEARELLTEAWNFFRNSELAKYKWYVILNRGVINKVTDLPDQALSDFQEAYNLTHEFLPFKNLYFMHLQMNQLVKAENLLNDHQIVRELFSSEKFEMETFRARLLCLQGRIQEAIDIMAALLVEENKKEYSDILYQIIAICFENDQIEKAAPWCDKFVDSFPALASGFIFTGYLFGKRGNKERALENYVKAESLLIDKSPDSEVYELANGYMALNECERAIPLFEKLANKNVFNPFSRSLINAYFQYGDLQAAFAIAEHLYRQDPAQLFLVEIMSAIYEETKQYTEAVLVLENFLPCEDQAVSNAFAFKLARLYALKKDSENVRKYALACHPENLSADHAFVIASLLMENGEQDRGMEIAYDTRALYFDQSKTHHKYISICFQAEQEGGEEMFPSTVRIDVAVTVKTEKGDEKIFLITDKKNAVGENVIRTSEPFALNLLGKSKGESITIDKHNNITHTVTIVDILDIYTHAFRESMALFETRFAGQQGIAVFHTANDGLGEQLESFIRSTTLDKNQSRKYYYSLYIEQKATIGVLAFLFKQNCVLQWFSLVADSEICMLTIIQNELPAVEFAVGKKTPLVLDLTSLLTMFFVSVDHNFLNDLENKLIVSESTLEQLQEYYDELEKAAAEGSLSVFYQNGSMTKQFIPAESIQEKRQVLQDVISWCRMKCLVTTPSKLLEVKRAERQQKANILGECFYDTMLLAEENNAAVISDDEVFKRLLRTEKHPQPFSTYQLVNYLVMYEGVSRDQFEKFRMALITWNYIHIPVSADQLWECLDKSQFKLTRPFTVAVKGLIVMHLQVAAVQLTAFLKTLYLHGGLSTTRHNICMFILGELTRRNDYADFKNELKACIDIDFILLPREKDEIVQLLKAF